PHSGVDRALRASVRDVTAPATLTVEVEIGQHVPPRRKGGPYRVHVRDRKVEFLLVYFHARAEALQRLLPTGQRRLVSGKVELFDGIAQMVHPDHVLRLEEAGELPAYEPVYPLSAGLTQRVVGKAVAGALTRLPVLAEWIDAGLKQREGWPDWVQALGAAHGPTGPAGLVLTHPARVRLAYDELFAHQVTLAIARSRIRKGKGIATLGTGTLRGKVLESLPYAPTGAQVRAVAEIAGDMAQPLRMNRLLQGDVGAGKTLVAFQALLIAVEAGGQGVMMAPTEILARQHFEGLAPLARAAGVRLELLTGRDRGADRAMKLEDLATGRIPILVGTHAVFQKDVEFKDLRLAVVDEQHRFGVADRRRLIDKGPAPHVLAMSA
ncbi:MAG: DEAD/DEAH box helicase, partial [Tabrizicola sp.]